MRAPGHCLAALLLPVRSHVRGDCAAWLLIPLVLQHRTSTMADAAAAPRGDAAWPAPWHAELQARVADVERAAAALLAVCEKPEARAALEVRCEGATYAHYCARRSARGPSPCTCDGAQLRPFVADAAPTLLRAGSRPWLCVFGCAGAA